MSLAVATPWAESAGCWYTLMILAWSPVQELIVRNVVVLLRYTLSFQVGQYVSSNATMTFFHYMVLVEDIGT